MQLAFANAQFGLRINYFRSMKMDILPSQILNFINGEFISPKSGIFMDNVCPATASKMGEIPVSSLDDVELAMTSAKKAYPIWSSMSIKERSRILSRLADEIANHSDELAKAECIDNGKPISLAMSMDIPRAEDNIRFFAHAIEHWSSEAHVNGNQSINYTHRKPIGVVACISPWNLPLYLFTWKIAPALAAGNCVVAKPSEITPLTAFLFCRLCQIAGLPPGVLNVLHGRGAEVGMPLVTHADIKAVSFTGGTATGAIIASAVAGNFKKVSLELGGKNPNIIFADCDFDKALKTTLRSSFANQGQICLCGSRILIERSIYEKFRNAFVSKVAQMEVGDPLEAATKMGALVSQSHMEKVLGYIDLAKKEGGKILSGGNRVFLEGRCADGFFIRPTIIEGLGPHCRTNQQEIFGPVVTLQSFDNDAEAVELANATGYGLAASIWTNNISRAHRISAQMECGIVWVNTWLNRDLRTPFGGVKGSGLGREGGWEALRFFTEAQNVCVEM
jgi:aminomuconate-semialdehyde/2-hydroxymuconate-6-semialdehyde dehydrogenase